MNTNFHSHTCFCDGSASVEEMVQTALNMKMKQLGFSSHAPLPFSTKWSMKDDTVVQSYLAEIHENKIKYQGKIELFSAIEADYIPQQTVPFRSLKDKFELDYLIGAVHLVKVPDSDDVWFIDGKQSGFDEGIYKYFRGNGKHAALSYFRQIREMIEKEEIDIIAHFDKIKMNNADRFFREDEDWYVAEILEILDLIKQYNVIMEINTRGYYQKKTTDMYPSRQIIQLAIEKGIQIIVNSDAHHPRELTAGFDAAYRILNELGYNKQIVRNNGFWEEIMD